MLITVAPLFSWGWDATPRVSSHSMLRILVDYNSQAADLKRNERRGEKVRRSDRSDCGWMCCRDHRWVN